jgi:DtxR family transcriptional regulator, Mn-dependent transcriptional regulator
MAPLQRPESEATEDYVKAIHSLEDREGAAVGTAELADRLGVTPGSASAMTRKLAERGLVDVEPYRGVTLTERGRELALEVIRHHRLLELYLHEHLGVPWDRVHDEAERLEHVLSEDLERRIADKLGDPTRDPHGDPIPTVDGRIVEAESQPLQALEPGQSGRFVRVSDSDPAMLRYLSERGIGPGDRVEVLDKQPFEGPLVCRFGDAIHHLGGGLATAMRVELDG